MCQNKELTTMMNESHTLLTTVVARNLMVIGLLINFE